MLSLQEFGISDPSPNYSLCEVGYDHDIISIPKGFVYFVCLSASLVTLPPLVSVFAFLSLSVCLAVKS